MAQAGQEQRSETAAKTPQFEWGRVLEQLKEEIGDTAYRSWLVPINLQRIDGGEAVIAAPARLYRDWVASHYADRILALWRAENRQVKRISVVVVSALHESQPLKSAEDEDSEELSRAMLPSANHAAAVEIGEERPQPSEKPLFFDDLPHLNCEHNRLDCSIGD